MHHGHHLPLPHGPRAPPTVLPHQLPISQPMCFAAFDGRNEVPHQACNNSVLIYGQELINMVTIHSLCFNIVTHVTKADLHIEVINRFFR
ncbi:hypothetical protein HanRHA438_Chr10g0452521 [Helianthus annuus]|nr:hypothetical protein HanRHA438_Chr10g0452521 [Helianthus annuus]